MKLDDEELICLGTVDVNHNSKASVYKDQNEAFCDLKAREGKADPLQYAVGDKDCWNSCENGDDSTDDNEKEVRDVGAPIPLAHSLLKIKSFDKDLVLYIDKIVMEPELPELVVCYKENAYDVVKDICVDDGAPSQDKFLFDADLDEKKLCTFLIPEKDTESEITSEKVDLDTSGLYLSKNELALNRDSKELMPIKRTEDDIMETFENDASKETFSLRELLSMPEVGAELSQCKTSLKSTDEIDHLSFQSPSKNSNQKKTLETTSDCEEPEAGRVPAVLTPGNLVAGSGHDGVILAADSAAEVSVHGHDHTVLASPFPNADEESENGAKEENLPSHNLSCMSKSTTMMDDEYSSNGKVEIRTTAFDFTSSASASSGGEKGSQNDCSKHLDTNNSSRHEDAISEPFSDQFQCTDGESSFSAAGPVSGRISYSGPIAYSGSLSLRSDSSTTSTLSFAFPILPTEWNSSPVRMAKADRRHFRKHRSWRQGLLCCCSF